MIRYGLTRPLNSDFCVRLHSHSGIEIPDPRNRMTFVLEPIPLARIGNQTGAFSNFWNPTWDLIL
jgi:hypothetical protein